MRGLLPLWLLILLLFFFCCFSFPLLFVIFSLFLFFLLILFCLKTRSDHGFSRHRSHSSFLIFSSLFNNQAYYSFFFCSLFMSFRLLKKKKRKDKKKEQTTVSEHRITDSAISRIQSRVWGRVKQATQLKCSCRL